MRTVQQFHSELADREAIRDCIHRYARGVDRCDEAMVRDVYWPDATEVHMTFSGTAPDYIDFAMPILRTMEQTSHLITNILIEVDGGRATVESYFQAFHRIVMDGVPKDLVSGGRYLDRFEKRDDVWRVAHREAVFDWFREYADSADWDKGIMGMPVESGGRYPDDISYSFMGALPVH